MLPTKFRFIWQSGFRVEDFFKSANIKIAHLVAIRKQTWPPQAILVSAWLISKKSSLLKLFDQISQNLVDASYEISINLAKGFQRRRFFRNQPIRSQNCLWWPCLFTDRN
jgi:hypothetical protein